MTKVKAMKAGIFTATKRVRLANGYKLIDTSILAKIVLANFQLANHVRKLNALM